MITLMRLRRGDNIRCVAHRYGCSEFLVRQIFDTWIQLLFHHFKMFVVMPKREDLPSVPGVFKPFPRISAPSFAVNHQETSPDHCHKVCKVRQMERQCICHNQHLSQMVDVHKKKKELDKKIGGLEGIIN